MEISLLTPSLLNNHLGNIFALECFEKGMNRNHDRKMRIDYLSEAISVAPMFREAYFWRGCLNINSQDCVVACLDDFKRALMLTSKNTCQYFIISSQIAFLKRNPEKTVKLLSQAVKLAKNKTERGEAFYFRSLAHWWIDKDNVAFSDCEKAIQCNYNIKASLLQLAEMAQAMSKPLDYVDNIYKKALESEPQYTELVKFGSYLRRTKRSPLALEVLEEAIKLNPLSPEVFEERALISGSLQIQDCLSAIELDNDCRLVQCRRILASLLADQNRFSEAIKVLSNALEKRERPEWYCLRGQLRSRISVHGTSKYAIEDLRRAVYLNPRDAESQFWLGRALLKSQSKEAYQRLNNAFYLNQVYKTRLDANILKNIQNMNLPDFKFFENESQGLLKYFRFGTINQSLSSISQTLELLINFAHDNDKIMYYIFRNFTEQMYGWASSNNYLIAKSAEKMLMSLWKQDTSKMNSNPIKKISQNYRDCNINMKKLIVLSDWPTVNFRDDNISSNNGPYDSEVMDLFLAFSNRNQMTNIKLVNAENLLNFAKEIQNNLLAEYLTQKIVTYKNKPTYPSNITLDFHELGKDMSNLINQSQFADIQFNFPYESDPFKKTIKAHKIIISSNCPYYQSMWNSGLRESNEKEFNISTDYNTFSQVLVHIYGGKVELNGENCLDILQLSDELGLEKLKTLVELYIGSHLTCATVPHISVMSEMHQANKLKLKCYNLRGKRCQRCTNKTSCALEALVDNVDIVNDLLKQNS